MVESLKNEVWKNIEGYENYQISNFGRVKSLNFKRSGREQLLSTNAKTPAGYSVVCLRKNDKSQVEYVHRLVALHFVDGYEEGLVVNHKNENPNDNHYTNLEWVTLEYNLAYGTAKQRARETFKRNRENLDAHLKAQREIHKNKSVFNKKVVCLENGDCFNSQKELADYYNVSKPYIHKCLTKLEKIRGLSYIKLSDYVCILIYLAHLLNTNQISIQE